MTRPGFPKEARRAIRRLLPSCAALALLLLSGPAWAWTPFSVGLDEFGPHEGGSEGGGEFIDAVHRNAARKLWPVAGNAGFAFGETAELGSYKGLAFGLWGQPLSLRMRSFYFGGRAAVKIYDDEPMKAAWEREGWTVTGSDGDFEKKKDGEDDGTAWDWRMEFEAVAGFQTLRENWIFFVEGSAMVLDFGVPLEGSTFATLGMNAGARVVLAHIIGFSATVGISQRDSYRAVIGMHLEGPTCGLIATVGSFLPLLLLVR